MITLLVEESNTISQEYYDKIIGELQTQQLTCSNCERSGCLQMHAHYRRKIKKGAQVQRIWISRVKCRACVKTHALLLSSMVPYSQIMKQDHMDIIAASESRCDYRSVMNRSPVIDESNIRYIIRSYRRHWRERLRSIGVTLKLKAEELTIACFKVYSRQFMQIKTTTNRLISVFT